MGDYDFAVADRLAVVDDIGKLPARRRRRIENVLMREHPSLTDDGLRKAQEFNFQRYYFAGIGRYAPNDAYARGLADLRVLADLIPVQAYVHGPKPTSIDAGIYGFLANIYFYNIETPLKQFVTSQQNMVRHCLAIHEAVTDS